MPLSPGQLKLDVILDQQSIDDLRAGFAAALQSSVSELLQHLADVAVRQMSAMDAAAGHPYLSKLWDSTPIVTKEDGSLQIEVYSHAEDLTFFRSSGATGKIFGAKGQTWPVDGAQVLGWLEAGEKAHDILPRIAASMAFKGTKGKQQSNFAGTVRNSSGFAAGRFMGNSGEDTIFAGHVFHPGFAGNRFLQATKQNLEDGLQAAADASAQTAVEEMK